VIAAKVELAAADEVTSTPATGPAVAAQAALETPKPASATATSDESSVKEGMKTANWIVLSALIGLGVAAAGFAVYKKTI
jgi:hypothetical protein